jgi:hypothetical protein
MMLAVCSACEPLDDSVFVDVVAEASAGQVAIDLQADLGELFVESGRRRPGVEHEHQHGGLSRLVAIVLQLGPVRGDKVVGFLDHDHSPAAPEHRDGGQLVEHFAQLGVAAVELCERQFRVLFRQHRRANSLEGLALQQRLVTEEGADRRDFGDRRLGKEFEGGNCVGHGANISDGATIPRPWPVPLGTRDLRAALAIRWWQA